MGSESTRELFEPQGRALGTARPRSPGPPWGLMTSCDGSQDSAYARTYGNHSLRQKDTERNQQRKQGVCVGGGGPGRLDKLFQGLLPKGSHRTCLISPVMKYDNTREMVSPTEAHGDPVPRVFAEGRSRRPHGLAGSDVLDSRRRAHAHPKPRCSYRV